ncbi:MAG: aromatic amino acid transport family protein [bacterium]|nr:aromatic amino acid transport family protein [bacterium]
MKFFKSISILLGTIIGAGVFGIPYVIEKSGIVLGLFYLLILGAAVFFIHLFFGEAILRTNGSFRLPGLSQRYLGGWGKNLAAVSVVIGVTGALLAFLILGGQFLNILLADGLSEIQLTLIFGAALSYFIFRGVKLIASATVLTNILFFSAIAVLIFFALPKFDISNISVINTSHIFLPFGVILFSLIGWSAVPEIIGFLKSPEDKKKIKKVIALSTIVVVLFYILFALILIGVAGKNTSQDALSGLAPFLGKKIIFLGALAGLITLADSFLVLGLYLRNTFIYDFKLSKNLSALIVCGLPLILFLAGFRSFINAIGFTGTIMGVIEGIIIILIFKKAKTSGDRVPEYSVKAPSLLLYFLMAVLILGALSQFFPFG